ncbi:IS3 family transposase [Bacillus altitudinis]|uniref:IS3 family transposase n=1 Tax=Bacillus TaxID=1386 RepID=UPI000DCA9636|nr:hypothetical protein DEJ56_01420 [Bacillus altitudinis]
MKGSYSRRGICLDNAYIESFFSHLKTENAYFSSCQTEKELHKSIEDYIQFYNHDKPVCSGRIPSHTGSLDFFIFVYLTGARPKEGVFSHVPH